MSADDRRFEVAEVREGPTSSDGTPVLLVALTGDADELRPGDVLEIAAREETSQWQ